MRGLSPPTTARDGNVVAQRVAPPDDDREEEEEARQQPPAAPIVPPVITAPAGSAAVEQTTHGAKPGAVLVESFDGLGVGFNGPQGTANLRNPSDNTLAVGPNHIVQIVNSQTAIFTKKGRKFDTTGRVLYGPVPTANFFKGFGGQCEATNNGDAVVRYDQIANRWLVVMPLFRRGPVRPDQPEVWTASDKAYASPIGMPGQPGKAAPLFQPPPPPPEPPAAAGQRGRGQGAAADRGHRVPTRCATRSARATTRWARTTATSSCVRSFPTIPGPQSGATATTCRRAPATTSSRSTPA